MQISTKDWLNYINKLSSLNNEAAKKMQQYVQQHGFSDRDALIDYAYGLVTKYGEGSAALSAQMYETIAEMSSKAVPPAIMAETASHNEVAKMVNGILKQSQNENVLINAVARKVKQAGADTTLQNALRDGAQFAWIPHGDTCAFCIALASRGWQNASKKAIKNGHAEHIHSNCDCTYAIRFDEKSNVAGYKPKKYLDAYNDASESDDPKAKINAMRRANYKLDADKIREQHRSAYAKQKIDASYNKATAEYLSKATPGKGNYIVEDAVDIKKSKNEIAEAQNLHRVFGGNIKVLAEKDIPGEKNPDYSWNGKLWDLKTTSTETSANSAIRKGIKQIVDNPGGLILDFVDNEIDMGKLESVIDKRMQWNKSIPIDIIVKNKGKYKVLRYNKE